MPKVKILHTADLHIGANESFLGTKAALRRAETLLTFERIVDTAKENAVQLILIAGDLLNSNKIEYSFIERIYEKINQASNIKIVFAAGNHDPLNSDSPLLKHSVPENLYILAAKDDCIQFDDLSVRVYGRSFAEVYEKGTSQFSILPKEDNTINIMCIHADLGSGSASQYNPITNDFILSSKMDYIALGHVHKRSNIEKIGNTYYAYCGCPEGQGFDETQQKGVYMGYLSKEECNLDFIPVCKRMHLVENFDISSLCTPAEISQKILCLLKEKYGQDYTENLYKITLSGEVDESADMNLNEILSRIKEEVYFAKLKDNTSFKTDLYELMKENSLKGAFVRNMMLRIDNAHDEEKELLKSALKLGLKAFKSEVSYNED